MRKNTLKEKLAAGKAVFGVQITFPSPQVVELLGHLGFDWVLIDNEHGSITVDNVEPLIMAAELSGMAPIVRPVTGQPEIISPFMDRGAWGVQLPHVNTADEARTVVDAVKYAPQGHRGLYSRVRPAEYGVAGATKEYITEANRETLVCVMLEEPEGIDNLGEMVKVEGVDVFFVGTGDLSASMGYPGEQTHPEVQKLVRRGVETIRGAGKIPGIGGSDALMPEFLEIGVQYFHTNVQALVQNASQPYLKGVREAASKAGM